MGSADRYSLSYQMDALVCYQAVVRYRPANGKPGPRIGAGRDLHHINLQIWELGCIDVEGIGRYGRIVVFGIVLLDTVVAISLTTIQ